MARTKQTALKAPAKRKISETPETPLPKHTKPNVVEYCGQKIVMNSDPWLEPHLYNGREIKDPWDSDSSDYLTDDEYMEMNSFGLFDDTSSLSGRVFDMYHFIKEKNHKSRQHPKLRKAMRQLGKAIKRVYRMYYNTDTTVGKT